MTYGRHRERKKRPKRLILHPIKAKPSTAQAFRSLGKRKPLELGRVFQRFNKRVIDGGLNGFSPYII